MYCTLLATVAAAGGVYLHLDKEVRLVVDGRVRTVHTFGSTVADLLSREGISLGSHDALWPPAGMGLDEGMEVRIQLAKEVTLVLNGSPRTIWVTGGNTVQDVLEQINLRAGRNAELEPSRGARIQDGDTIVYSAAVAVQVTADGRTRKVITNAGDVGELLDSLGVIVHRRDELRPRARSALRDGMSIRVTRVQVKELTQEESIAYGTRVRHSSRMDRGQQRVVQAGREGLIRRLYRIRTEDGREVHRTLLRERVVRQPVTRIVVQGTRPTSTGQAESGVASWYQRDGMVAAHKTLPFGTRVTVTNLDNGRSVTVVIDDRGPYVEGRIIDLSDDAFAQLAPLSQGTCRVRITW